MQSDISLLRKGVILPHFKVLSSFLDGAIRKNDRILDINCREGDLFEMMSIMQGEEIDYVGVDEDQDRIKIANSKNLPATFRSVSYDNMKLHSNSYDIIIVQSDYFDCSDIFDKINNLFRASRKYIIFYKLPVLTECDTYKVIKNDSKTTYSYGVSYLREIVSIMEPKSIEYSYVAKGDDPIEPTASVFVIRV